MGQTRSQGGTMCRWRPRPGRCFYRPRNAKDAHSQQSWRGARGRASLGKSQPWEQDWSVGPCYRGPCTVTHTCAGQHTQPAYVSLTSDAGLQLLSLVCRWGQVAPITCLPAMPNRSNLHFSPVLLALEKYCWRGWKRYRVVWICISWWLKAGRHCFVYLFYHCITLSVNWFFVLFDIWKKLVYLAFGS